MKTSNCRLPNFHVLLPNVTKLTYITKSDKLDKNKYAIRMQRKGEDKCEKGQCFSCLLVFRSNNKLIE